MFLYIAGKIFIALFVTCPNCNSSNVREETTYQGYTEYYCINCSNKWTE